MAPLFFKEIKGMGFSCSSASAAAICKTTEPLSMVHHDHHLRELRRTKPLSQPSSNKTTTKSLNNYRRSMSSAKSTKIISPSNSSRYLLEDDAFIDVFPDHKMADSSSHRRYSTSGADFFRCSQTPPSLVPLEYSRFRRLKVDAASDVLMKPARESVMVKKLEADHVSHSNGLMKPARESARLKILEDDHGSQALMLANSSRQQDQVVELRVSLHCKGCEGKVRKHISKMQGVSSFSINPTTKKVTVIGDVTPLGVLNSISKVKSCQFWPSPPRASASF